jgi:L-fuconolactonase
VKIDSHQHFWSLSKREYSWLEGEALTPIRREFGPQELVPELEAAGLDGSILVQTCSSVEETLEFLEIAAQNPAVMGVVGWVDLTDPEVGHTLDTLKGGPNGRFLVGIRHGVQSEADPMWLMRADVNRGLEQVRAKGLAYDLLITPRDVPAALETARAHPELTFVIDHAAKPNLKAGDLKARDLELERWKNSLEPFVALPNVYIKLSGLATEADWKHWTPAQIVPYFQVCLEQFGPERCMYGSDWPVCLLAANYGQTLEWVVAALEGRDKMAQDAVLGGTAARAYRLAEKGLLS